MHIETIAIAIVLASSAELFSFVYSAYELMQDNK